MIDGEGYAVREAVFTGDESSSLLTELSAAVDIGRAGVRNLVRIEAVAGFARDVRLLNLVQELTGRQLIPFKAILFNKTGKANWLVAWHQDTALPVEGEVTAAGWGQVRSRTALYSRTLQPRS